MKTISCREKGLKKIAVIGPTADDYLALLAIIMMASKFVTPLKEFKTRFHHRQKLFMNRK